jgi:predicted enzyme related to lactoylglutathione lyase
VIIIPEDFPIKFNEGRVYIIYLAADLDRAKNFYQDIFRFDFSSYESKYGEKWLTCSLPVNGARFALIQAPDDIFQPVSSGGLILTVKNIEETKIYLENKAVDCSDIIESSDDEYIFRIKDSEGNSINIMQIKE